MTRALHDSPPPGYPGRVHGCWLGKSVGGTLGLPAEGTTGRLHFTFYDPVPTVAPPNDDLELQLVWLHLVEGAGRTLTQTDFARAWVDHIHYMWDEYGRCRWNLRRGVPVENVGTYENHFQSAMGSPIRSEIWACLFPGDAESAAYYAALDASLDHGTEGIAGEVFFAVMQSAVAGGAGLREAIALALPHIPRESETARAIQFVLDGHSAGDDPWEGWSALLARHGSENFTHAPLNVALTIWALVHGAEDFEASILLAVNGGYDTDCTAATVGATLGLLLGQEGIPERWSGPIGEDIFVGPGILGIRAPRTLGELTSRVVALSGKLAPTKLDAAFWSRVPAEPAAEFLGGNVVLTPRHGGAPVTWANGELPPAVKRSGGAAWTWHVRADEPRIVVCLARHGAKLFVDDALVIECPAGLPYVPAIHRCPEGSSVRINPAVGVHTIRLELKESSSEQEASVILAYPNKHMCPWTPEELPDLARLSE